MNDDISVFLEVASAFLCDPSQQAHEVLKALISQSKNYDPDWSVGRVGQAAIASGQFEGLLRAINSVLPGVFLNPSAHFWLAKAYEGLGDQAGKERELAIAELVTASLLGSGDGTEDRPYRVLMIQDEYDILSALREAPNGTELVRANDRMCDVIHCDERRYWFELEWWQPGGDGDQQGAPSESQ